MNKSRLDKAATFANRYGVSQRKLQKSGTSINNLRGQYNALNPIKWPVKRYIRSIPNKSGFYSMNDLNSTLQYITHATFSLSKPTPRDYIRLTPALTHLDGNIIKYIFDNIETYLALLNKDYSYLYGESITEKQADTTYYKLFSMNARLKYLGQPHSLPDNLSKTQRKLLNDLDKAFKAYDIGPKAGTPYWDESSHNADATAAFMLNNAGKPIYYQRTKK